MDPVAPLLREDTRRAGSLLAHAVRRAGGDSDVDSEVGFIAAVADRYGEPVPTKHTRYVQELEAAIETY